MADWMSSLSSSSTSKSLSQLYIPGSDNACSHNLDERDEVGLDLSNHLRGMASFPFGKETLGRWMKHQHVNLETQLLLGVRYLHIKVASRDGHLFALNGLYSGDLNNHLHAIHRFLVEHKKEIIILHFTDFARFSKKDLSSFDRLIDTQFGDLLLTQDDTQVSNPLTDMTIKNIWKAKRQVIVSVDSSYSSSACIAWMKSIWKISPRYESISKTCKEFEKSIMKREEMEEGIIVFDGVVSLCLMTVLERPFGKYEKEYGRPTTRHLEEWIRMNASTIPPFILSTHFVDEGSFCQSIVNLNFY
ncbi:hypothetical protein PENTCL1PPCAC_2309 [Pristionchus entomophagus]|uniref:Phosphatidylinositol-specific phospholipase C X domain-containing protein n=1 Tax=Pristionchus entomophagus TaxID=358040 RepID=A0AAV5SBH3_9BILA|nr:hypothetical protein PENTCL1PPCAC_2309 [Pristionchus entomophagus]